MELRTLSYFLAVAREGSILGAANTLHLTQPNLSRQMKELELEVGKQLFIRSNRNITLTEDGILLRKRADEILTLVKKTESELAKREEAVSGEVYIGSGEFDSFHYFSTAARHLTEKHPDICFHIYSGNSMEILERLEAGLLDFGLLIEPVDVNQYDFLYQPAAESCGVIMRKDNPLAQKDAICPEDLRGLPLIMPRQFMEYGFLTRWIGEMPEKLNIIATTDLPYNATIMVADGMGYSICIDFDLFTGTSDSKLCFRPFKPGLNAGVYIVWKKYQPFSKAAQAFLEQLKEDIALLTDSAGT